MSIKEIAKQAKTKVSEMGGGEQYIGLLSSLAKQCAAKNTTDFLVDLGEALESEGLQLVTGAGAPNELYASPLE